MIGFCDYLILCTYWILFSDYFTYSQCHSLVVHPYLIL